MPSLIIESMDGYLPFTPKFPINACPVFVAVLLGMVAGKSLDLGAVRGLGVVMLISGERG